MITISTILLVLSLLTAVRTIAKAPRVVHMQTARLEGSRLRKRDHQSVILGNAVSEGLYYVNASVGTPIQNVALQIDTGSSDVWMFGPGSCDARTSHCLGGAFDPSQSNTVTELGSGFSIRYVTPGSGIIGNYIADSFGIGDMTVQNLTMAVATTARYIDTGIMGIGFDTDESLPPGKKIYPNIIDDMMTQGLINTRAYSLWLDNLNAGTGTILFGGYDTEKYTGSLVALELQPDAISGRVNTMTIAWTSLSVVNSQGSMLFTSAGFVAPVVLDSGTSYTGLPIAVFNKVAAYFGAVYDENYGYLVYCNISQYEGTLDYGFGGSRGPVISVKYAELAIPVYFKNGTLLQFSDGSYACSFGIFPVSDGEQILFGDTFLRSSYVVYDLDNKQVALAPTNFGSTRSNVVEIGKGGGSGVAIASNAIASQTRTKIAAPGAMGAVSATGASVTDLSLSGSLGGLTMTGAQSTNGSRSGTAYATTMHISQSVAAAVPVTSTALLVLAACLGVMVTLGRFMIGVE